MKEFELTWSNITVSVDNTKRTCFGSSTQKKIILHNANGKVQSGSFVGIMGPSGAGKTTLLATLGGKIKDFRGSMRINDVQLSSSEMKKMSGYMNQCFVATESLTVEEHLAFMIALKARIQLDYRNEVLEHLLTEHGLDYCKGTELRYLSGGERKKVSLATEIVRDPKILYCDEPTTGLDSSSALNVMESLRAKAASGKIVIFIIHQPSSQLYNYFDQIILLASGRTVFQGTRASMQTLFDSIGVICPRSFNPAEFYVNYLVSSKPGQLEKLQSTAKCLTAVPDQTEGCFTIQESYSLLTARMNVNILEEITWLNWRAYINAKRNIKTISIEFGVFMMTAVTMFLLFPKTRLNGTGVQNYNGMLYFTTSEIIYTSMFSVLYAFPGEYDVFLAEESVYSPYSYFISKILTLIPKNIIFTICFLSVTYSRILLPGGFYQLLIMILICWIGSMAGALFGLCVSANFRTLDNIASVVIPWTTITTLVSGIFVKITALPIFLQSIKYLSPFYYVFQSLAIVHWKNIPRIDCSEDQHLPCYKSGTDVLTSLGIIASSSQVLENMAYLILLSICWSLVGLFGITRRYKIM